MAELTRRLGQAQPTAGPVLFTCRHRVYGVGMFDVATVLAGDAAVAGPAAGAATGRPSTCLVGTGLGLPRRREPAASAVPARRRRRSRIGRWDPAGPSRVEVR